jgi:hypothetical protein
VHSGLLLSALWDAIFDDGLVTFGDDGIPVISENLSEQARARLHFDRPVDLSDKHRVFLEWRRTTVFDVKAPKAPSAD